MFIGFLRPWCPASIWAFTTFFSIFIGPWALIWDKFCVLPMYTHRDRMNDTLFWPQVRLYLGTPPLYPFTLYFSCFREPHLEHFWTCTFNATLSVLALLNRFEVRKQTDRGFSFPSCINVFHQKKSKKDSLTIYLRLSLPLKAQMLPEPPVLPGKGLRKWLPCPFVPQCPSLYFSQERLVELIATLATLPSLSGGICLLRAIKHEAFSVQRKDSSVFIYFQILTTDTWIIAVKGVRFNTTSLSPPSFCVLPACSLRRSLFHPRIGSWFSLVT